MALKGFMLLISFSKGKKKKKEQPTKPAIKRTANSINKKQYGHQHRHVTQLDSASSGFLLLFMVSRLSQASSMLLLSQGPEPLCGAANTLSVGVRGYQGENQQAPIISLKRD